MKSNTKTNIQGVLSVIIAITAFITTVYIFDWLAEIGVLNPMNSVEKDIYSFLLGSLMFLISAEITMSNYFDVFFNRALDLFEKNKKITISVVLFLFIVIVSYLTGLLNEVSLSFIVIMILSTLILCRKQKNNFIKDFSIINCTIFSILMFVPNPLLNSLFFVGFFMVILILREWKIFQKKTIFLSKDVSTFPTN